MIKWIIPESLIAYRFRTQSHRESRLYPKIIALCNKIINFMKFQHTFVTIQVLFLGINLSSIRRILSVM